MNQLNRRLFLLAAAALPIGAAWAAEESRATSAQKQFMQLELDLNGRLGVFAFNTADGSQLGYRANERFPVNSTFKVILASAILKQSEQNAAVMEQRIKYTESELVANSPITEKHLNDGMTVAALCAAAIQYSDNTAANLLMKMLGGPDAVTAFAESIGDKKFHLDRWETDLNTAIPGDPRDTTTPRAMGMSLKRLAIDNALPARQREQLLDWLRGNTTGATRIRAGAPADWQVADKTGTGSFGSANDIAVVWPPHRPPVIIAVYTTQRDKDAKPRNDIIASAARTVVEWLV